MIATTTPETKPNVTANTPEVEQDVASMMPGR